MTPEKLIAMANQIGMHFMADPDPRHARQQIADHMQRFWAPMMRRNLIEHVDDHEGASEPHLCEIVVQAIAEHRERLLGGARGPAPATPESASAGAMHHDD
ncbi:hypothetical protein GCM10027040_15860 [Halomonas shantousis]